LGRCFHFFPYNSSKCHWRIRLGGEKSRKWKLRGVILNATLMIIYIKIAILLVVPWNRGYQVGSSVKMSELNKKKLTVFVLYYGKISLEGKVWKN
jgi:hypothetical protein